jgi:hypothetical protein
MRLAGPGGLVLLSLCIAAVLAGCASRGRIDNPVERKVTWFSYLDGSDIRTSCGEGSLDRYRLVYNASYEEQVRAYEVTADGAGGAYLVARVKQPVDLSEFSFGDVLGPWRWAKASAQFAPAAFKEFRTRLAASGFGAGAPVGLRLPSPAFYWVASGCQDGVFHFAAWLHPQTDLTQLPFTTALFANDGTGIAISPPRVVPAAQLLSERGHPRDFDEQRFALTVHEHGFDLPAF